MRHFNFYLYDSYDPKDVQSPIDDPRIVLNEQADAVLSIVAEAEPGTVLHDSLPSPIVDQLIHTGLLRQEKDVVLLDSTVILREDAVYLQNCFIYPVSQMSKSILSQKQEYYRLAQGINNGFSPQINLYHLLCGSVFDGYFFDYLCQQKTVTTSRLHASGLDYLIIAYEQCDELDSFSRNLLCSYNRFTDGSRALQSFGDANGDRLDVFRFAAQKRLGIIPEHLKQLEVLWDSAKTNKSGLLNAMQSFIKNGACSDHYFNLLNAFGYIQNGTVAVPVYSKTHGPILDALESLTESLIGEEMKSTLGGDRFLGLVCSRHGVKSGEIANELYHILFGQINEKLVESGFVATPPYHDGEGRYLQSIEFE